MKTIQKKHIKTLSASIDVAVRFSETDPMGVVWHGNYLKFFEDAREHFGRQYGLEYLSVYDKGYFIPIVKSEINHVSPIFYGEKARVHIILEKHRAAKLVFRYEVLNLSKNQLAAKGQTIQVFMNAKDRELEIIKPAFYEAWESKQNWK